MHLPDSLLKYAQILERKATPQQDKQALAHAALFQSWAYEYRRDLSAARTALQRSRQFHFNLAHPRLWADQQAQEAILLFREGHKHSADSLLSATRIQISPTQNPDAYVRTSASQMYIAFALGDIQRAAHIGQAAETYIDHRVPLSTQAQLYSNLGTCFTNLGEPDKAIHYLNKAIQVRKQQQDAHALAFALLNLGVFHSRSGDTKQAIISTKQALSTAQTHHDSTLAGDCMINLALYYRRSGLSDTAWTYYDQAWNLFTYLGAEGKAAAACNGKALILNDNGDQAGALQLFMQGRYLARRDGLRSVEAFCAGNLALLLSDLGYRDQADRFAHQCYTLLKDAEEPSIKGSMFYELGNYFLGNKDPQMAQASFQHTLQTAETTQSKNLQAKAQLGFAKLKLQERQYEAAYTQAATARQLLETTGDQKTATLAIGILAQAQFERQQYKAANTLTQDWITYAQQAHIASELAAAWKLASRVAEHQAQPVLALRYARQAQHLQDSIAGAEKQKAITALQALYELKEKQTQITDLSTQLATARLERERDQLKISRTRWIILSILALVVLAATTTIFWLRRNIQKKTLENLALQLAATNERQSMETRLREVQQQALQTRMNPHFTFNCLNSIQALILSDDPDTATIYIARFGKLVRQAFEFADKPTIPLEDELAFLDLYCRLENLRLGEKAHIHFDIPTDLDTSTLQIPPMVVQPILENAFQHGLSRQPQDPTLEIKLWTQDHTLIWRIRDNGGPPTTPSPTKMGIQRTPSALNQISERLRLQSPNPNTPEPTLQIQAYPLPQGTQGTEVILRIPFH